MHLWCEWDKHRKLGGSCIQRTFVINAPVPLLLLSLLIMPATLAQDGAIELPLDEDASRILRRDATPRQPTVLTSTLSAQELDRAVLNRLMQEIAQSPEATGTRLGVDGNQLQDIFITISNGRSFINGNEMAAVRAMCRAWEGSTATGEARIQQALDAYIRRNQFTKDFIERYYRILLADIEAMLSPASLSLFRAYMEDRRQRMANSGVVTMGAVVENTESGRESIAFHCRP